ncbi:GNAT family N-acetyltransferase [Oceanicaulis sp.]|uniref:GNAT family N-acetyltransferase n=1 Tax=Oceanicaulis sp. TaxID=1924941 RepID=UPI003BAC91BA
MGFTGLRLVRSLDDFPVSPKAAPDLVIRPLDFDTETNAARALLNHAYRGGEGERLDADDWRQSIQSDAEFDPDLCLQARDARSEALVGVIQAWSTGFIKDLAVDDAWRAQGVGAALLAEISVRLRARGIKQVSLKVVPGNLGAIAFYEALGFERG